MTALEAEVGDMSFEEVANYEGTFEDAVSEEVIPQPELMQFNDWQIWRKKEGLRPTKRLGCIRATTTQEEAELWRRAMQYYFGDDWRMVMEMNQILVEEDEGVLNDQAPSQTVNPAGFTLGMSPVAEPAGLAPAVADTGAGTYALSEGMQSERTSSTLSGPGTPRGLQMLLEQPYDPSMD